MARPWLAMSPLRHGNIGVGDERAAGARGRPSDMEV
jgi:hypothetical protein